MRKKFGFVYIMSNKINTVLYVGVTSNLPKRAFEHRNDLVEGFTKRYKCHKLVYFEQYDLIIDAIAREKQIKKWSRKKKDELIDRMNHERKDLFDLL